MLRSTTNQGFGAVWRCKLGGFTCAIKIVNTEPMAKQGFINFPQFGSLWYVNLKPPDLARKRVMQEIELLQRLQHRHIVSFLGKEIKEKVLFLVTQNVPITYSTSSGVAHLHGARASLSLRTDPADQTA